MLSLFEFLNPYYEWLKITYVKRQAEVNKRMPEITIFLLNSRMAA
jgi:hypothetical protein